MITENFAVITLQAIIVVILIEVLIQGGFAPNVMI
jgi:hypothetical protein